MLHAVDRFRSIASTELGNIRMRANQIDRHIRERFYLQVLIFGNENYQISNRGDRLHLKINTADLCLCLKSVADRFQYTVMPQSARQA